MNEEVLKNIGLSDHEIRIYLSLLRLGSVTATKLARETNTDRATTYRFLDSLITRGLVNYVILNNVKYFKAAHPKKISEDLKNLKESYDQVLPELESLLKLPREETKVELYKGKEGLKTIMKDILREKKSYTFIGEVEKFFTELSPFIIQWLKRVEEARIRGKLICIEGTSFKVAKTEQYKLISKKFISRVSTWTYGSKTALFIWSKPLFGVLIDNEDVTKSNSLLFNFLWGLAKKPTKQHENKTKL